MSSLHTIKTELPKRTIIPAPVQRGGSKKTGNRGKCQGFQWKCSRCQVSWQDWPETMGAGQFQVLHHHPQCFHDNVLSWQECLANHHGATSRSPSDQSAEHLLCTTNALLHYKGEAVNGQKDVKTFPENICFHSGWWRLQHEAQWEAIYLWMSGLHQQEWSPHWPLLWV